MSGSSNQSTRTSPGSFSTAQRTPSVSSGASPTYQSLSASQPPSTAQNVMSTDVYSPPASQASSSLAPTFTHPFSPLAPSSSFDTVASTTMRFADPAQSLNGFGRPANGAGGTILMRKLPRNTSREALRAMLLFAKDLLDTEFIPSDHPEDNGYLCALARFGTLAAAEEARALLHGKPNSKNDATMVVEVLNGTSLAPRRNTIDHTATRSLLGGVNGALPRQSSRFNGTFQNLEKLSAINGPTTGDGLPDSSTRLHNIFSPQSPLGNGIPELPRVSGKSMIDQDIDEDTGELLKDPVGYAENGHSGAGSAGRRATNPQILSNQFAGMSLATNLSSPPLQAYTPQGSAHMGVPAPASTYPQAISNIGASHPYPYGNPHMHRHSLPAANPNDMNPPCNTLYVGNLPPDTSEEELKALFSKQRGYKRLCFRNKQNGPMCFVEFDDVGTAGKALNELYGVKLSNSIKTGIRLSFSKNPLGVRSGQPGSLSASNNITSQGGVPGGSSLGGIHNSHVFSTVSGPPPGLAAPPGLAPPLALRNNGPIHPASNMHAPIPTNGAFNPNPNPGLGIRTNSIPSMASPPPPLSGGGPNLAGFNFSYPDYMMGR
ncbi:RNA-binding protein [Aspergillus saccharolyticus JOP 1030-1]|uniref:RRM domain-containing protein n=1 Tax=Aspergillus saccharolyticus JOP 1030-1 TaxID=1450539 RepID=A0A318Z345_9EURO|nr:hypothetical protein BP01DRAFT_386212 [Aspergillus saccharolyticus JOP 1030-1]PYH41685.1 hypothetical protein BP01DRAFT_386212 [Aspergillus saccharolyticus JOP 1030-1]